MLVTRPVQLKNVLHLCESSDTGGAESVLISLAEGLDKKRYRSMVCLLSEGWLKSELDRRRIDTVVIPQPNSFDFLWLLRARRLLKDRDIDVMHSHEFATNAYACVLSRMTGIPLVATVHGKNYYGDKLRRRVAYRYVARHSTMVAVSSDLKRFMTERVGIPADDIRVVRNGIDLGRYKAQHSRKVVRQQLGIDDDQRVIGTVGNLFAVKGHSYLLQACQIVHRACPDVVLLVAGEGDQLDNLRREAADLGIAGNVRFLGFRDDVPALLQAMEVFVLPSLSEGLPLCVLEALALEKPVVATNVGGVAEIVDEGVSGYLVPPKDAKALAERTLRLLGNPRIAASMGQAGRRKVEEAFRLETMVREYQLLYEESGRCC